MIFHHRHESTLLLTADGDIGYKTTGKIEFSKEEHPDNIRLMHTPSIPNGCIRKRAEWAVDVYGRVLSYLFIDVFVSPSVEPDEPHEPFIVKA